MLVFNCHVTNYHKVSSLDSHRLTILQFPWGQGPGTCPTGALSSESQKAAVKVSTRGLVSRLELGFFLPSLCGCWQSSLPCSHGLVAACSFFWASRIMSLLLSMLRKGLTPFNGSPD